MFNEKLIRDKMKIIKSKFHRIGICKDCKISLSCFDDQNIYILDDGINSFFS